MDLTACLKILADRKDAQAVHNGEAGAVCPCCYDNSVCGPVTTPADAEGVSSISEAGLRLLTSVELIDYFCLFQAQRVQVCKLRHFLQRLSKTLNPHRLIYFFKPSWRGCLIKIS